MARSLPVPYYPAPTPENVEDLPRYLEDEFQRIRYALIAQPVAMAINHEDTVPIGIVASWATLFIGQTPEWEAPGGQWDPTAGEWTCPASGLYDLDMQMQVDPFGAGNKNYYAGLRMHRTFADGSPDAYYETYSGGSDDVPLGVSISFLHPITVGDLIRWEGTAVHENQTGVVDVKLFANIIRASE